MKVVFLTWRFWPDIGGVETHVLKVSEELVKLKHEVTVIAEEPQISYNQYKQSSFISARGTGRIHGITTKYIKVGQNQWFKKFKIWHWLWINRALLQDADVIHVHDVYYWYLPFRLLWQAKPNFITFHGHETTFPIPRKNILLRKIYEKLAWGNICVGDYLKKWYGTKPNYVVYGGVEAENTKSVRKSKKSTKLIVMISRLEQDMAIESNMQVINSLKRRRIDFNLEVLGDGPLRTFVESFGTVHGFLPNPENFLRKADIVFSSSYLSILQAISYKKFVVSMFNNQLKEDYLRMSPFSHYVQIGNDPDRQAKIIEEYLKNMSKFNDQLEHESMLAKQMTWKRVTNAYIKLWSEAVTQQR